MALPGERSRRQRPQRSPQSHARPTTTHGESSSGHADNPEHAGTLRDLKAAVETVLEAGDDQIDPAVLDRHRRYLRSAATIGINQNTGRDGDLAKKHAALARRLLDREEPYLRFAVDFTVPFDNNAAEREIRMVKLRQKISGCLRTLTGARQFATIRSYLATARKHGLDFYDALLAAARGTPWTPATA